jgi:hypothetical protein
VECRQSIWILGGPLHIWNLCIEVSVNLSDDGKSTCMRAVYHALLLQSWVIFRLSSRARKHFRCTHKYIFSARQRICLHCQTACKRSIDQCTRMMMRVDLLGPSYDPCRHVTEPGWRLHLQSGADGRSVNAAKILGFFFSYISMHGYFISLSTLRQT